MKSPEERITELEIKASFADDLLEQINDLVARQQQQIDALRRELLALREQVRESPDRSIGTPLDERPPHY